MSLLQTLRSETASLHRELDEAHPLSRPDLDLALYARILSVYRQLHEEAEAVFPPLETAFPADPDLRLIQDNEERRRDALARDQAFLRNRVETRHDPSEKTRPGPSEAPAVPAPAPALALSAAGPAQALGTLYVIAGSALGGPFIARRIRPILGLPDPKGWSFFEEAGRADREAFQALGRCLEKFEVMERKNGEGAAYGLLIEGARAAFLRYLEAFRILH